MSDNPTGGPAFPSETLEYGLFPGMSLRDWFAGQALSGMINSPHVKSGVGPEDLAHDAYQFADAMLKAREDIPHD